LDHMLLEDCMDYLPCFAAVKGSFSPFLRGCYFVMVMWKAFFAIYILHLHC